MDYKGKFCYEYDQLLFDGKTPEEYFEIKAQLIPTARMAQIFFGPINSVESEWLGLRVFLVQASVTKFAQN